MKYSTLLKKRITFLLIIVGFVAASTTVLAQVVQEKKNPQVAVPQSNQPTGTLTPGVQTSTINTTMSAQQMILPAFKSKLNQIESSFSALEKRLNESVNKIKRSKVITFADKENAETDKLTQKYSNDAYNAFNEAVKNAQEYADSKGKSGNIGNLKAFEDLVKIHESKLKALETKMDQIDSDLKAGKITIDKEMLQKATPSERLEFKKYLTPQTIKQYDKAYPDLKLGSLSEDNNGSEIYGAMAGYGSPVSLEEDCYEITYPAKVPSIAIPCVAACYAQNWVLCVSCLIKAGPAAVQAWNSFNSCWGGAGKKWWTPWWVWRAYCVGRLIVVIA